MGLNNTYQESLPDNGSGHKIMILSDDLTSLKLMRIFIGGFVNNSEIRLFKQPCDLVNQICSSPEICPDVLIVDFDMPTTPVLELIESFSHFFNQTHGVRPPFRIVLYTDLLHDIVKVADISKNNTSVEYLKALNLSETKLTNDELHVDVVVSKPLDAEKIGFIFSKV